MPMNDSDWLDQPQCNIVIRRHFVLDDALKEAKKWWFDPHKLLRVTTTFQLLINYCSFIG